MKYFKFFDETDPSNYNDFLLKRHEVLKYCEPHLDQMWAASIAGILLGCDFRDCKFYIKKYFEWIEREKILNNE